MSHFSHQRPLLSIEKRLKYWVLQWLFEGLREYEEYRRKNPAAEQKRKSVQWLAFYQELWKRL